MKKKDPVCNFDCFHCVYDDCISDSSYNPIKVDDILSVNKEERRQKKNAQNRNCYEKHKDERSKKQLDYYYAHREEILKKRRERRRAGNS